MLVCISAVLAGCNRDDARSASNPVRVQFRQAVAAVKVCAKGATYREFRERRMALATCYAANRSALSRESADFLALARVMDATDALWNYEIEHSENPPYGLLLYRPARPIWDAMITITPSVEVKANFTFEQCTRDRDFYAPNYVPGGLTLISACCDKLLADR